MRVGLLVDSYVQPGWVRRVVQDVRTAGFAELALVVLNGAQREPTPLELVAEYRRQLLPLVYDRVDAALVRHYRRPDAFARASIADLTADCPSHVVSTVRKRYSDFFPDRDVEAILAHDLDVALRFGFRILRGRALEIARYGVWSYHHADNLTIRGGPNSFWEVMEGRAVTGAVLQVLTEELDAGRVLYRTYSATNPLSLSLNRNSHYWKASAFVIRKLRELHERGASALDEPDGSVYRAYSDRIYRRPGNLAAAPILARFGARLAARATGRALFEQRSSVACRVGRRSGELATAFHNFRLLSPPPDRSWSEPFPVAASAGYLVLARERLHAERKDRITLLRLGSRGDLEGAGPVLEQPRSLGYPQVVEWSGERYLLATPSGRSDLMLYRAGQFPFEWEPSAEILRNVEAANATLAELDGWWWLFVALAEPGATTRDELHLFRAPGPGGPWISHKRNPVKSDVRSARPAGAVFRWRGRVYRPAQDCSVREGYAISINLIERLSLEEFREVEVSKILPRWRAGLIGNGVMNHAGGLTCIDASYRVGRLVR